MTDLDALEAVLAKATPGEWQVWTDASHFDTASDIRADGRMIAQTVSHYPALVHDTAAIVALHNAAAALIAEHRAALAEMAEMREALRETRYALVNERDNPIALMAALVLIDAALAPKP